MYAVTVDGEVVYPGGAIRGGRDEKDDEKAGGHGEERVQEV